MEFENKQIFFCSSKDRVSGTPSDFLYSFNLNTNNNYDYVGILAASVPKSFYLITTYNDEFILTENGDSVTIHIPVGNYTLTSWIVTLTTLLNNNSPNNWTYSITYPKPTAYGGNNGHFIFNVSGNIGQPSFTFNERLYQQMGFNPGTYTFTDNILESINVINLQLLDALFINCDVADNGSDSVLQEIYNNNEDYSNITYQAMNIHHYSKKIAIKNNSVYHFYLTNSYGETINLNGLDWNFTIIFYKLNNVYEMHKNFIKLSVLQ